jgi:hypothetical protein
VRHLGIQASDDPQEDHVRPLLRQLGQQRHRSSVAMFSMASCSHPVSAESLKQTSSSGSVGCRFLSWPGRAGGAARW